MKGVTEVRCMDVYIVWILLVRFQNSYPHVTPLVTPSFFNEVADTRLEFRVVNNLMHNQLVLAFQLAIHVPAIIGWVPAW